MTKENLITAFWGPLLTRARHLYGLSLLAAEEGSWSLRQNKRALASPPPLVATLRLEVAGPLSPVSLALQIEV